MAQHRLPHLTILAVIGAWQSTAHAQAWVPDKGELGISLDYNLSVSDKVVKDVNADYPDGGTTGHQITLGAEYTPIDRLAVNIALPFVMLKYTGADIYPHDPTGGSYDDHSYHSTLTDFRAGVRYQVLEDPIALAPHLAFSIPLADYETIGNTVGGRHLKMAHVGLSLGTIIGIANYVHLSYEFTLAEKYDKTPETKKISQNHSDLSFAVGTKVLDYRLDLHLAANARIAHDGIDFTEVEGTKGRMLSINELLYHDAILAETILLVGGGLGYDISDSISVSADFRYFIEQVSRNTQNASVLAVGVAWSPL